MKKLMLSLSAVFFTTSGCSEVGSSNSDIVTSPGGDRVTDGNTKEYTTAELNTINTIEENSLVSVLVTMDAAHNDTINARLDTKGNIVHNITGSGFIIGKDEKNYYVATNNHVIDAHLAFPQSTKILLSKANVTNNLKTGNLGATKYDVDSDRAVVLNDQVMFVGDNVAWPLAAKYGHTQKVLDSKRTVDFVILEVPISEDSYLGFNSGYDSIPLADPIEYKINGNTISEPDSFEGLTTGYPAGYLHKNKGTTGDLQILTGDYSYDYSYQSQVAYQTYWQQDWYFEMFQAGGSSGSPIFNENGELLTILANGYSSGGTEWTGGPSINEIHAAFCKSSLISSISVNKVCS